MSSRNITQVKERIKAPEKELNKMKISNLSDAEFETLVIRVHKELSEDLNSIKKIQSEMKDTVIEIKNNLQGNNSRVRLRSKSMIWYIRKQKQPIRATRRKKNPKNEDRVSSLWDNFKLSNIHIIGVREEQEKEQEIGYLKKIIKENFHNFVKEIVMQVQEAQRVQNKKDAKRPIPRHIIIKMPKVKDKESILKAARNKKLVSYMGVSIRLSADLSKETLQAGRDWQEVFKMRKIRDL
ncbi:hypothetical protein HJG60_009026 [Phyllostomus discolor]|uniref:L1 transposable element RRM domain-containing protein n=1 Tax=Phyllostomus discolor TaxID=89673 RepID=A0A833YLT6_9CHIR|nr:hypothetical protein HJG60_009026 [Phyllostomus discolor]